MKKHQVVLIVVLALGLGFLGGHVYFKQVYERPRRAIFLAEVGIPEGALVYIAYNKTFFASQGYNITLVPHTSGRDALEDLISGKVDLATAANTPAVRSALEGKKFKVLATIGRSKLMGIMSYKDTIPNPAALVGTKIGVALNTNGEYFLDLFLARHNIPESKIIKVNMDPDQLMGALIQRKVQSVVAWNPYSAQIQQALGDNLSYFGGGEFFNFTWNLVASEAFVSDVRRAAAVVRGLDIAREYLEANPADGRHIVANSLRVDGKILDPYWSEIEFDTTLDQSLIIAMESQANWYMKRAPYKGAPMPNFLEYLYPEALMSVSPEKVGIIR